MGGLVDSLCVFPPVFLLLLPHWHLGGGLGGGRIFHLYPNIFLFFFPMLLRLPLVHGMSWHGGGSLRAGFFFGRVF